VCNFSCADLDLDGGDRSGEEGVGRSARAVTVFPGPVLSSVRVKTNTGARGPYPSLGGGWKWAVKASGGDGA
jgi:hypothetical protein